MLNRTGDSLQPAHDRCGRHLADSFIGHDGVTVGEAGHPGQPGDGLLDEDVAWPARDTRRPGSSHHLHRHDAVPAEFEERLLDADALEAEHLGVDLGEDLFDGVGRGAVPISVLVFGCRQGAGVELAVDGQRHRRQHDHRGGHHVWRQLVGQRGAHVAGFRCAR